MRQIYPQVIDWSSYYQNHDKLTEKERNEHQKPEYEKELWHAEHGTDQQFGGQLG